MPGARAWNLSTGSTDLKKAQNDRECQSSSESRQWIGTKAQDLSHLTPLTQSNNFWKTAGIQEKALADLEEQLKEMLRDLGSAE